MMAIMMLKPDSARARPSTLINSDVEYKKIFSLDKPIDIYLKAIQIMKATETYLKPENCAIQLERKTITNIKFYVAMIASIKIAGSSQEIEKKLSELPNVEVCNEILSDSLKMVLEKFNELGATDQVAKGSTLAAKLLS